jgi:uncharacterized protein YbbK (DUF523 family)
MSAYAYIRKMCSEKAKGKSEGEKEYVLVSLCILGTPCRYHGKTHRMGHRIGRPQLIEKLRKRYSILPLCPEITGGLSTPRPACRVVEDNVIDAKGIDRTAEYKKGAEECLRLCQLFDVKCAYLLKDSPACGKGYGVLAKLLESKGIRIVSV